MFEAPRNDSSVVSRNALGIPYRETGALLVAVDGDEASRLPGIAENAARNGVEVDLLTEKEAKKKWCPFARAMMQTCSYGGDVTGTASTNRDVDTIKDCMCLGSGCAVWNPNLERCGLIMW